MNAATAFEHRKEALRAQLAQAKDMDEAIRDVTMTLEQVSVELMQDEQDETARQRQQAVLALVRRAPGLLAGAKADAELRVETARRPAPPRAGLWARLPFADALPFAGALILAALAIALLADGKILFAALQVAGVALLLAGRAGRAQGSEPETHARAVGVLGVDADALVRAAGELCAAADVCAGDLALIVGDSARYAGATADDATIDLLVSLVEAQRTGRGDVALGALDQARQRLCEMGIEAVDYDREHAALFDLLPTLGETRTLRPALFRDGKPLRRGVAVCRAERSVAP